MSESPIRTGGTLRQDLSARNASYAVLECFPTCHELRGRPVVVYRQSDCGRYHGNFIAASYRAILKRPEWRRRLKKVHTQAKHSLPKTGLCLARTRFLHQLRRFADHFLLSACRQKPRVRSLPGNGGRRRSTIWVSPARAFNPRDRGTNGSGHATGQCSV